MRRRRAIVIAALSAGLAVWYLLCLPRDLFADAQLSTVVLDRNGELIGARIASDGQWRFPADAAPSSGREKYFKALVRFEDRWFRWHPGVNPVSIVRAAVANARAGHVVSGGSTISMQVIRMSRRKPRTLWQKAVEAVLVTRLELRYSKDEILELYAANAPFGGNVVGLEAASWRYFGRPSGELSWAEAATLAVLPNSPSSIRPGKGRDKLLAKRNRLLVRLRDDGLMGKGECALSCSEPLPSAPMQLPSYASHLVDDYAAGLIPGTGPGRSYRTDIDLSLQRRVEALLSRRSGELALEGINDLAAVVMDVRTGQTVAYCGNADPDRKRPGADVDIARSPRSSGSILKPFLYCAALQDGVILPYSLLPDTPVNIGGFTPQNYSMDYFGAVPAAEALSRSLNVPAVHLLKAYGVQKFLEVLRGCGMTTFGRSAEDYGLSLILGGGECRLDEVTAAYAAMARQYLAGSVAAAQSASAGASAQAHFPLDDRVALWYTLDALKDVNRPDEMDWRIIRSVRKVAWKTGTSYGYRDAWAVGATPDFAVGVWAGNASGVGSPVLLGARTAGPVLFEIFGLLPSTSPYSRPLPDPHSSLRASAPTHSAAPASCPRPSSGSSASPSRRHSSPSGQPLPGHSDASHVQPSTASGCPLSGHSAASCSAPPVAAAAPAEVGWFPAPAYTDGIRAEVCRISGFLAGEACADRESVQLPASALHTRACPYHFLQAGKAVFHLPPAMEWFYRRHHPEYGNSASVAGADVSTLVGVDSDVVAGVDAAFDGGGLAAGPMEFIYPESGSVITISQPGDGTPGGIVLNLAHRDPGATVYWHLDGDYLGETRFIHHFRIHPSPGRHTVTVVDSSGATLSVTLYFT